MLEFKKLELEHIPLVEKYLIKTSSEICDVTIGGIFIWRDLFKSEYALYDDMLFFKVIYLRNEIAFSTPMADDKIKAIEVLKIYCKNNGLPFIMCTITEKLLVQFKEYYKIKKVIEERDWFDYFYLSKDLINFTGKKYSTQRNNINKFKRMYSDNNFEKINNSNLKDIKDFFLKYSSNIDTKANKIILEDTIKTHEVLDNYTLYNFVGGVLYVYNEVVGFVIGEIRGDVFFIHIEKGNSKYKGVYQVLVNEVCRMFCEDIKYVNREDDSGEIGMRESKLRYRPIKLLEKLTVYFDE